MSSSSQTIDQFFTRQGANEGTDLPLILPDGSRTKFILKVRGVDSDAFRNAQTAANRATVVISQIEDEKERLTEFNEVHISVLSSLVISWNLENEFTEENVKRLIREAPYIGDQIDRFASKRSLFIKGESTASNGSPEENSNLASPPKGPTPPSEAT